MKIEIKSAKEWRPFEKTRQDCVVASSLYTYLTGTRRATPDRVVMVGEDEEMVNNVHILSRTATVGSQQVHLGGIGNLGTKVEWRKGGFASEALKVAVSLLHDPQKGDFDLIISTEEMVLRYERTGWKLVAGTITIEQAEGKKAFSIPVLVLPVGKTEGPAGPIDPCGLPW